MTDVFHYLLIAGAKYTRGLRAYLREEGDNTIWWSAPADLKAGDLALLYEAGRTAEHDGPLGRQWVEWIVHALSDAEPDPTWGHVALFEAAPLRSPLHLAAARSAAADFPLSLQGKSRKLSAETWDLLLAAIVRSNPHVKAALSSSLTDNFGELSEDELAWASPETDRESERRPTPRHDGRSGRYLLISRPEYVRGLRPYLDGEQDIAWAAPATLAAGDLALLYETGSTDAKDAKPGRKQIDWIFRATSDAEPGDGDWRYVADYEAMPLRVPVRLDSLRRCIGFPRSLEGTSRKLSDEAWSELLEVVIELNPYLVAARSDPSLGKVFAQAGADEEAWGQDDPGDGAALNHQFTHELALQKAVTHLLDDEGWSRALDPGEFGLLPPSSQGYHLAGHNRYVDDVRVFTEVQRCLLVIEYERHGSGNPAHGAQQAHDYRQLLQRLPAFTGWKIDALVVAEGFDGREEAVAANLGVECLQVQVRSDSAATKRRSQQLSLAPKGSFSGAVAAARPKVAT